MCCVCFLDCLVYSVWVQSLTCKSFHSVLFVGLELCFFGKGLWTYQGLVMWLFTETIFLKFWSNCDICDIRHLISFRCNRCLGVSSIPLIPPPFKIVTFTLIGDAHKLHNTLGWWLIRVFSVH